MLTVPLLSSEEFSLAYHEMHQHDYLRLPHWLPFAMPARRDCLAYPLLLGSVLNPWQVFSLYHRDHGLFQTSDLHEMHVKSFPPSLAGDHDYLRLFP